MDSAFALIDDAYARFSDLDDRYGEAYALCQQGHALRWIARYEEAEPCLLRSEALRRELRDRRGVGDGPGRPNPDAASAGAAHQARALGRDSVALMEESGDIAGLSVPSVNLALAELLLADFPSSLTWVDRALAVYPIPGGYTALGWLHLLRSHLLRKLGDIDGSSRQQCRHRRCLYGSDSAAPISDAKDSQRRSF